MRGKWTPGPLHVEEDEVWPFRIRVVDATGVIESFDRYAHSTRQKTLDDLRRAVGFDYSDRDEVIAGNERQLADITLRAAAPALYEALEALVAESNRLGPQLPYNAPTRAISEALEAARAALSQALPPKGDEL